MSDPNDILGKTDALLGRYRGGIKPAADLDFPVLTEVVAGIDPGDGASRTTVAGPSQSAGTDRTGELTEDRILQEVIRALAHQLDEMLGDVLKERLEEHLRNALQQLTDEVHQDIEALARIAVSRAVEQVLSEKKNP